MQPRFFVTLNWWEAEVGKYIGEYEKIWDALKISNPTSTILVVIVRMLINLMKCSRILPPRQDAMHIHLHRYHKYNK